MGCDGSRHKTWSDATQLWANVELLCPKAWQSSVCLSPLLSSLLISLSWQMCTHSTQMSSGVLQNLLFLGSVHSGRYPDQLWFSGIHLYCTSKQQIFSQWSYLWNCEIYLLPCHCLTATSEDCKLLTTGCWHPNEVCSGKHVTVWLVILLRLHVWKVKLKVSLLSVAYVSSEKGNLAPSYHPMVDILSFTSQCFQN